MTEEQRRALFALREALRLCHEANVDADGRFSIELPAQLGNIGGPKHFVEYGFNDFDKLLAEHPEP